MKEYFFILNPFSRRGSDPKFVRSLTEWIEKHLPQSEIKKTLRPNHAGELAVQASEKGFRRVIAIGGDGTLHEVVNGLAQLPLAKRPALGTISTGTGGDFFRMLKEDYSIPTTMDWLKQPREIKADMGYARIKNGNGKSLERHFVNIADAGISGEVIRRVNASQKLLGSLEYLRSTLSSAWVYAPPRVRIFAEEETGEYSRECDLLLLVVANGRYFGGGMCIAPTAQISDGRLDWMITEKISYFRLLRELPNIYLKRQIHDPKVHYGRGTSLKIEALRGSLPVGMDGEFFWATEVFFQIVPQALKILVPSH